jgi:hypothetical protein
VVQTRMVLGLGLLLISYLFLRFEFTHPHLKKQTSLLSQKTKQSRSPASTLSDRGFNVTIHENEIVYLDESTNLDSLTINGELRCDEESGSEEIILRVKRVYINGTFRCGTSKKPYTKKLIISLKPSDTDPIEDHSYRAILVMNGGKLLLFGDKKNTSWYRLAETAHAGENSIRVQPKTFQLNTNHSVKKLSTAPKWSVGDKIAIAPTGFNYAEAEDFIIQEIDSNDPFRFYLDRPLDFTHWGESKTYVSSVHGKVELNERAEVANLTRSIVIRADEDQELIDESDAVGAQVGGHVMSHYGSEVRIDSVEFFKMGQAGIMMRYPFHWHYVANASGQFIKNSSVHHSYQRCIVVHRTHKTLVENNVCYNFKGHGFFLEDGNEIENKIVHNLAIMAKAPSPSKVLLASDNINDSEGMGRFPSVSAFWISNPNNYVAHNIAAGSIGTGFWMSFEKEIKNNSGQVVATPITTNTNKFDHNIAHATKVGITWDGARGWENPNNPNNPDDLKVGAAHYAPLQVPTFKGLIAYKNYLTGIYFRGQTAIFENAIVADNGWSFWLAYNQIVKDSVFIGQSPNSSPEVEQFYYDNIPAGRHRKTGIVIYDGPFEIHNSDFFDYSTAPETRILSNGTQINSSIIPITSTGGSQKFTNLISQVRFSPEPYNRMFLLDMEESWHNSALLGHTSIRDLDGSFANTSNGSVIVGKDSLGITSQSGCFSGGEKFKNLSICPANYKEAVVEFSSTLNALGTAFAIRRSDGALSVMHNKWSNISSRPNHLFSIADHSNLIYELLPLQQFEYYRSRNAKMNMRINSESLNFSFPIIKINGFGKNCALKDGANKVNQLSQLYTQASTSYYSSGSEFYVRLLPTHKWQMISIGPQSQADAYATYDNKTFEVECDAGELEKTIKGEITSVVHNKTHTIVSGWACNYTVASPVQVKLLVKNKKNNALTQISQISSNNSPDPSITMKCGRLSSVGRKFSFSIPKANLANYKNHTFLAEGISNTGGANLYLVNSDLHSVLPPKPQNNHSTK